MRIRPIAALSVAAFSAVLLAGCASGANPNATPAPSTSGGDVCASAAPDGDVVKSVNVGGEFGDSATADFAAPLAVESAERTVVVEGEGTPIGEGDYVSYALAVFDASTGDVLEEAGFGEETLPPLQITVGSGADAYFGCAREGSRIAMTIPANNGGAAQLYVIDVLEVTPAAEWCAVTEPGADFPTVEFSEAGAATITIPDAEAPADVQLEVIEEGDGEVVEPGDTVTVDYTGVKWSDGSVFDANDGVEFATTGVVAGFQRALEGQKVGSTILVSMPPLCGYGEAGTSDHALAGETLVFSVKINETARP